ncbi:MAG: peroxiredoxin [Xanthomonadales bacterium]|nr:peroxiredoxin [Gammaproteobacteria bacterium]NNE05726.1 peroxiredoxin [Xanthomonadales bacterium]NNL94636.1 peroxiredoxin [Xanthomonadales bacterium]
MHKFISIGVIAAALLIAASLLNASEQPAVGSEAPNFHLQDQNGDWHRLEDYRGEWLAIYFYPKDDTPGCTTQACSIRDNMYAFEAIGAKIVGISVDSVSSHKDFSDKYKLPFILLADESADVAQRYGVLRNLVVTKMAKRESFIVNPEGVIVKHYRNVDPETHTEMVLGDLQDMMGAGP